MRIVQSLKNVIASHTEELLITVIGELTASFFYWFIGWIVSKIPEGTAPFIVSLLGSKHVRFAAFGLVSAFLGYWLAVRRQSLHECETNQLGSGTNSTENKELQVCEAGTTAISNAFVIDNSIGFSMYAPLQNLTSFLRGQIQDLSALKGHTANNTAYSSFCNEVCNHVADVFIPLSSGHVVSCAIRLADDDSLPAYYTRGRSSNLSSDRALHSKPVTSASGVYKALESANGINQVLVIHNVSEALDSGLISRDYNLTHHGDETRSMMIARMNVRLGDRDALWGFLYVSSPDRSVFDDGMRLLLLAISDAVSSSMWSVVKAKRSVYGGVNSAGAKTQEQGEKKLVSISRRNRRFR